MLTDYVHQPGDLSFVLTEVLAPAKRKWSPLYGRVDPKHVGVAGMSLGGATVFGLAVVVVTPGSTRVLMDPVALPFANSTVSFQTQVMFVHIQTDPVAPI